MNAPTENSIAQGEPVFVQSAARPRGNEYSARRFAVSCAQRGIQLANTIEFAAAAEEFERAARIMRTFAGGQVQP